jgi:hypothetical protein
MQFFSRVRTVLRHPSAIPRSLNARRKFVAVQYRQRRNGGIFSVDIHGVPGFFAQLSWCIHIFSFCESRNLIPHIVLSGPQYVTPSRGPNWLEYFFEPYERAAVAARCVTTVRVRRLLDLGLPTRGVPPLTIERAARLARKYLKVRVEITAAVDEFVREHFEGRVVLGVHYRGTDKAESPRVPYEQVGQAIRAYLEQHAEVGRLFVATDERPFLARMEKEFATTSLCYCDDLRSSDNLGVHLPEFSGDGYRKGREALLNALLLARCNSVVRTASALSGWASVFNPGLPVTLLNRPFDRALWFPDKQILARLSTTGAAPESAAN